MHNTGEILQLCRLCLVKEQVNVPIFEGQGDVKQIFQKISSCLPVKINRSDKLPKNICDGCSEKLDLFYDFWNTSVNSEKQLLEWLGQTPLSAGAGTTIAAKNSKSTDPVQQIKVDVKQEPSDHTDNNESFQADASAVADEDETSFKSESGPPPKRARRAATKRKPITVAPDTDDDDDDDYEPVEPLTKLEDESGNSDNDNEDDSFANAPSTSADDQPGPSGIGKDGVEAPSRSKKKELSKRLSKTCQFCGRYIKNVQQLEAHVNNHLNLKPYQCDVCEKAFASPQQLKTHQLSSHAINKRFKCDLCPKEFYHKSLLTRHRVSHQERGSFQCYFCSNFFKRKNYLKTHIQLIHLNQYKMIKCEACGMEFKRKEQYDSHQVNAHGATTFICKICGQKCATQSSLKQHEDTHNNQKIQCDICQKMFSNKLTLRQHRSRIHSNDRKMFVCDLCGKVFKYSEGYQNHKLTHEGVTPYSCEVCGKGFVQKRRLTAHKFSHTGGKPFQCMECGNGYTKQANLLAHVEKVHKI